MVTERVSSIDRTWEARLESEVQNVRQSATKEIEEKIAKVLVEFETNTAERMKLAVNEAETALRREMDTMTQKAISSKEAEVAADWEAKLTSVVSRLQADHTNEIESLKDSHRQAMEELIKRHEKDVSEKVFMERQASESAYEAKLAEQEREFSSKLEANQAEAGKQRNLLQETVVRLNDEVSKLRSLSDAEVRQNGGLPPKATPDSAAATLRETALMKRVESLTKELASQASNFNMQLLQAQLQLQQ
ncbi:hypothetical protein HK405_012124, partial [Cladochytrium tenue]